MVTAGSGLLYLSSPEQGYLLTFGMYIISPGTPFSKFRQNITERWDWFLGYEHANRTPLSEQ